jgi:hypothetical protein
LGLLTGANLSQQREVERLWQVKCYLFHPAVSVTLKSKIRYNGKEYSTPAELPPEVRLAYEKALHDGTAKRKFVVNGAQFASDDAMPADVRKLCDDVMSVIENNGEVTLPNGENSEPLLTKREIAIAVAFGAGILALVLARIAHG